MSTPDRHKFVRSLFVLYCYRCGQRADHPIHGGRSEAAAEVAHEIGVGREDPAFAARLARRMEADRPLLERIARRTPSAGDAATGVDSGRIEAEPAGPSWLATHDYVEPQNVGGWCEFVTLVSPDGLGSVFCGLRPSAHDTSADDAATDVDSTAVRCDCANHENQVCDICQRWNEGIRDRRATDVDSTAEVCACGHDESAHKDEHGDWTCCQPMWRCGCLAYWGGQRSAGSPVTAGVPDTALDLDEIDAHATSYAADGDLEAQTLALTAEIRRLRSAVDGQRQPATAPVAAGVPDTASYRATFGLAARANPGSSSWHIVKLCEALDAARGELVSARGENAALRVELAGVTPEGVEWQYRPWIPPAQRTADDWSSMVAVARNRAWAAEAELAAANARIAELEAELAGYDGCCGQFYEEGELRAGVPAAGDAGEETR